MQNIALLDYACIKVQITAGTVELLILHGRNNGDNFTFHYNLYYITIKSQHQ